MWDVGGGIECRWHLDAMPSATGSPPLASRVLGAGGRVSHTRTVQTLAAHATR